MTAVNIAGMFFSTDKLRSEIILSITYWFIVQLATEYRTGTAVRLRHQTLKIKLF